jgi:thiol-disulfide isomerase/thioredoxin
MRRGHVTVGLLALALLAGCGNDVSTEPSTDGGNPDAGQPAVVEVSVNTVTLDGLMDIVEPETPRTKPLVVNLWAHWCPECVAEIPHLIEFHRKLGDRADLIGVSMDFAENEKGHADLAAAVAAVREGAEALKVPYEIHVADPGDGEATGWYTYLEIAHEVPWTVIFDEDGIHRGAHPMFENAEQAMAWFDEVMKGD